MKGNKTIAKIIIMMILVMMFSYTTFADTTEESAVEETTNVDETTEEATEEETTEEEATEEVVEPVTAIISIDLGYEVLLTVDENGVIIAAEIVEEDPATEEEATEDPATEESEEEATEDPATEESEEEVTEDPATEESDEEVIEDPLASLIGSTLNEGIQSLITDLETEEEFEFAVEIYADDEALSTMLNDSIVEDFGDMVAVDVEESEDGLNKNAERFANAEKFGITAGKMNLLEKLNSYYDEESVADYSEWANKSVKEIMAEIKANKKGLNANDIDEEATEEELEEEADEEDEAEVKFEKSVKKSNNGKGKKK